MMKSKRANRTDYMVEEAKRKIQLGNASYVKAYKVDGQIVPAMFWVKSKSRPNESYQILKSDVDKGFYKHVGCWAYNVKKWCSHAEAVRTLYKKIPTRVTKVKKKIPNSRKKKRS